MTSPRPSSSSSLKRRGETTCRTMGALANASGESASGEEPASASSRRARTDERARGGRTAIPVETIRLALRRVRSRRRLGVERRVDCADRDRVAGEVEQGPDGRVGDEAASEKNMSIRESGKERARGAGRGGERAHPAGRGESRCGAARCGHIGHTMASIGRSVCALRRVRVER